MSDAAVQAPVAGEQVKIGDTLIPPGGLSFEETQKAIENDPIFAEKVREDLELLMQTDPGVFRGTKRDEELPEIPGEEVPRETAKPEEQKEEKPTEPIAPSTEPKEAEEKPVGGDLDLTGTKIKPEWLSTYLTGRTPAEAIEEMYKGVKQKDAHIYYLSDEKIPAILKEKEEAEARAIEREKEIEKLREELKAKVEAKPETQTVPKQEATSQPEAAEKEIVIPPIKDAPKPLTGDASFEADKIEEYNKAWKEHIDSIREHDLAVAKKELQETLKQRLSDHDKQLAEIKNAFEAQIKSVKDEAVVAKETADNIHKSITQEEEKEKRVSAEKQQYAEFDALVDKNPYAFGKRNRSIQEIERDRIRFLQDLAVATGVQGSIYKAPRVLREDILRSEQQYTDINSPSGKKLRDLCETRGIALPPDYSLLQKVYEVNAIKNTYGNIPLDDALYLLARKNPDYDEEFAKQKVVGQKAKESQAKVAVAEQTKKTFAREADPSVSPTNIDVDNYSYAEFDKITSKRPELRTDYEKTVIAAVCKAKGLDPNIFG